MRALTLAPSCQPWPASPPVVFRPGLCYTFAPHAAPRHITPANFGWIVAAWLIAGLTLAAVLNWFTGQYEVTRTGLFRFRVARRWYGARSHVCLKNGCRNPASPDRFEVLEWGDSTDGPWLCVRNIDFAGYAELGPPRPRWMPAEDFAPHAVRRFRPGITLRDANWRRSLSPFWYETVPGPDAAR